MFKEKTSRYSKKYNTRRNNSNGSIKNNKITASTIPPEVTNIMLSRDNSNSICIEEDIFDDVTPFMKKLGSSENMFLYDTYEPDSVMYKLHEKVNLRTIQGFVNDKIIHNPNFLKWLVIVFLSFCVIVYVSVIIAVTSIHDSSKRHKNVTMVVGETSKPLSLEEAIPTNETTSTAEKKEISLEDVTIPMVISNNLANVNAPYNSDELPILWHIPRSGGTTIKIASFKCLDLVLAAEFGGMAPPSNTTNSSSIEIIELKTPKGRFINIDVSTAPGLEKAKNLGLASSHKAQLLVSRLLYNMVDIFDKSNQGRIFSIFRHPNDITYSLYQATISAQKAAQQPIISLNQYLESPQVPESWIVRQLSGNLRTSLKQEDLLVAKAIIQKKFLVGLLEDMTTSLKRILSYYHWEYSDEQWECISNMWLGKSNESGENVVDDYKTNETLVNKMNRLNEYDIALYEFVQQLFVRQGQELF